VNELLEFEHVRRSLEELKSVTAVEFDPDIVGAVMGQAELLMRGLPNKNEETIVGIYRITGALSVKLTALRYHSRRFRELQQRELAALLQNETRLEPIRKGVVFCEKEMVFEFEAFFFQFKAALDQLVKLMPLVLGLKASAPHTYGKKGKDVITYLNQLKKNSSLGLAAGRLDELITLVINTMPWLGSLIDLRDTVSHYGSFVRIGFSWDCELQTLKVPMGDMKDGSEVPLAELMERESENLIKYSTEFVSGVLLTAIPLTIRFTRMSEREKRYFSTLWAKDLSRAVYNLSTNVLYRYSDEEIEQARLRGLELRAKRKSPSSTM
jgi:hypothetical protein